MKSSAANGTLSKSQPAWNAADYAANAAAQRAWARELLAGLHLQGTEVILDVGCGDGAVTAEIAGLVPRGHVIGVDNSPAMIAHAQEQHGGILPHLEFRRMDARQLFLERPVDVVFSNAALHWVDDHPAFLQGAARALRPGGRLVVSCGGRGNAADMFKSVRSAMRDARWRSCFRGMERPYHFFGPEKYRHWLAEAGLVGRSVQLTPRDMLQPSLEALAGWLRTTWLPYTQRVPEPQRAAFIQAVVDHFAAQPGVRLEQGWRVRMVRLEIIADKLLAEAGGSA